jgi:hypothetical protein
MKTNQLSMDKLRKRFRAIEAEGQKWIPAWRDLAKYHDQTRGRFDGDEPNRGKMIDHKTILDGKSTQASTIMASGMQSGMTSPSRPWFKIRVPDIALMKIQAVGMWCDEVTKLMLKVCDQSNIYGVFYSMYKEIGIFGVAVALFLEDIDKVIRGKSFTIGEYYLGINAQGIVDTLGRKYKLQVNQMVEEFGYKNCSPQVQGFYDTDHMDNWIEIIHLIEPNTSKVDGFVDQQNMAYRSVYWEPGQGVDLLAFRGFEERPFIAPRWDTVTTDTIYGYGPGWNALGNAKQLQKTQLDKLLAQEKSHNPPMQKDASVEGHVNLLPGGVTTTSSSLPNAGVRPAYQINSNLESFIELINSLHAAIDKDFFVDLFLMMVNFDKSNMTATEVAERQQEKIMMMGPVLERLQNEMLDPFLDRLFNILERNMLLPPPPEELQGMNLEAEYVSILAQAQRAIGVNAISRVIGFVGGLAPLKPDVVDVIDLDESIREVAALEGIPAKLVTSINVLNQQRAQRQQAEQMQQNLAMAATGAKATKDMANAKMTEPSALTGTLDAIKSQ